MTIATPPIVRLAERLLVDVELAVSKWPRAHRYLSGADLRRAAMRVAKRSLRDQCAAAGVPFLFKQWGEWGDGDCDDERTPIHGMAGLLPSGDTIFNYRPPFDDAEALRARHGVRLDGRTLRLKVGKKRAGRLLDGVEHNGVPA